MFVIVRAKDQQNALIDICSGLESFDASTAPDEETASLISKLKKSIFEKQNKNKIALNRLAVKPMLNGAREYLQTKSKEFDTIVGDPSLQTEMNLTELQTELSVYQDKLSRDVESELPKLDKKSRTEMELSKDAFETNCGCLVDKSIELAKKAKLVFVEITYL